MSLLPDARRNVLTMSGRLGLAFALSLPSIACATNPATGRRELSLMSEQIVVG